MSGDVGGVREAAYAATTHDLGIRRLREVVYVSGNWELSKVKGISPLRGQKYSEYPLASI